MIMLYFLAFPERQGSSRNRDIYPTIKPQKPKLSPLPCIGEISTHSAMCFDGFRRSDRAKYTAWIPCQVASSSKPNTSLPGRISQMPTPGRASLPRSCQHGKATTTTPLSVAHNYRYIPHTRLCLFTACLLLKTRFFLMPLLASYLYKSVT